MTTNEQSWLISSDSHIVEPPDLWTARADDSRLPHVVREADGDWWYIDGRKTMSFLGIQTGMRFEKDPTKLRTSATFEEVTPAAYDPSAYLKANEQDGVWGSVIYPSEGLVIFSVPNTEVVSAAMAVYNDWIADFCSHDTSRLKGIGMVNVDDVAEATAELRRCHDLGLGGVLITVAPPTWLPYRSREFDAFWATAEELQMPLSLHVGTDRADSRVAEFVLNVKDVPPSVFVNKDYPIRRTLADLMFSGVFERHPGLRIGTVEHELGWIPFFLQQLDNTYTDKPIRGPEWKRLSDPDALPSQFFRTNCFASFQEDSLGIRLRDEIGVETLMWGSDYPHTESTFPRSREVLEEVLQGVSDDERALITSGNAAELYSFALPGAEE
ncbi:MAG TPA: amidohydrolase family protein [Frankiaceae bacterium]|jgi:predicted TIM-barrel fold metal-dependent hydrolase|nr:amidohydrolase family protein [Frankiaceae bacterium]